MAPHSFRSVSLFLRPLAPSVPFANLQKNQADLNMLSFWLAQSHVLLNCMYYSADETVESMCWSNLPCLCMHLCRCPPLILRAVVLRAIGLAPLYYVDIVYELSTDWRRIISLTFLCFISVVYEV